MPSFQDIFNLGSRGRLKSVPRSDEASLYRSRFTTKAQMAERQSTPRRILWAVLFSLAALVAFILLGPDAQSVKEKFEYYGVEGELSIMPEINIIDGQDRTHQLPKNLMAPPPPSHIEIEPEELSENGTEFVPEESPLPINEIINDQPQPTPDADEASEERVELNLPQQSNPDWFITHQVRPEYPLTASEEERRLPVIFVQVAIFVGPDGKVTDAMVQATNGSSVFSNEVLERVKQWEFGWRVPPGAGRWIAMTWNFNSPYFTGQGQ